MFNATPSFPRLTVIAEVEFQGRKVSAMLMVDGEAWGYPDVQDEVRRRLKQQLADEILQVIDPKFIVQQ